MLSQQIWLQIKPEIRKNLAVYLNIPKSSGCEVASAGGRSVVISDGYTYDDLATVTLEKLQEYLAMPEEKDFYKLFGLLVKRLEEPEKKIEEVKEEEVKEEPKIKKVK